LLPGHEYLRIICPALAARAEPCLLFIVIDDAGSFNCKVQPAMHRGEAQIS